MEAGVKNEKENNNESQKNKKDIHVIFSESFQNLESVNKKQLKRLASFMNQDRYLNEGGAAKVYTLRDGSCMKVMKNRHKRQNSSLKYDLGLSPLDEFKIMQKANKADIFNFRSPKAQTYIETGNASMIIMEELNADSLIDILNGKAELPEGFDYEKFYNGFADYLESLHSNGVVHGDLFPRNIMISKNGDEFYVIDFGRSLHVEVMANLEAVSRKDFVRYDEVFNLLENYRKGERVVIAEMFCDIGEINFDSDIKIHHSKEFLAIIKEHLQSLNNTKTIKFNYFGKEFFISKEEKVEGMEVDFEITLNGVKIFIAHKDKYLIK